VIISDNASEDNTAKICARFVDADSRFLYVRQKRNIGPIENFRYIINQCQTKYFVFLAADDFWYPEYLEKNIAKLESVPSAICSVSEVVFGSNGNLLRESNGTFPLEGGQIDKLKKFFSRLPNDNSRFYGVFRTQVLQKAFSNNISFHVGDWYLMALTLLSGTHIEVDVVLMYREAADYYRYMKQLKSEDVGFLSNAFPVYPMMCAFMRLMNFKQNIQVLWPLLRLNYRMFIVYAKCNLFKLRSSASQK